MNQHKGKYTVTLSDLQFRAVDNAIRNSVIPKECIRVGKRKNMWRVSLVADSFDQLSDWIAALDNHIGQS